MTIEERIKGRKIGILGMARSGLAVARLAQSMGGVPFVSDSGPETQLTVPCDELRSYDIPFETGGHTERLLACDYLVVSPGVPLKIDIIGQARAKGLPIFSELEVASWVCPGRIVAITGSNGKTTTTTLIGELLTAAGRDAHVCGNIGRPLADVVERMNEDSIAVVEVSSFQLETISVFKPEVAVILNLTPDHIDRHGSFDAYKKAKYRITENQVDPDVFILNQEDPESVADNPASGARRTCFTTQDRHECETFVTDGAVWVRGESGPVRVIGAGEIGIKGPHNLQNVAAAVAVANQFGTTPDVMARVLTSFPGVEHRLEQAGAVAGVAFVNDSKATNVDSVRMALRSVETPLYLILGGRDKAGVFEPLIDEGRDKIRGIIAIGEAKEKVFDVLGKAFPTQFAESLQAAVELGFRLAHPGETVLLSPGCASFDMFENFEHRGRVFKETVQSLKNGKNSDETVSR